MKQRLRRLRFRARSAARRQSLRRFDNALNREDAVATPAALRPPAHQYRGHRGPWIEDWFYRTWASGALGTLPVTYLPIFWTDYYLHCQIHLYSPAERAEIDDHIERILREELDPSKQYFTIVEYDHPIWDWHRFPRNVLVFSAGGGGDIPIPLLNADRAFRCPPKDILVSFMGNLGGASDQGGVRRRMFDACRDIAMFGEGPRWLEVTARSTFTLCPRGLGRTSFRLYEAMSVGSIPIYIWDDVEWLPYQDRLDWNEFALSVHVDDVAKIPELVAAQTSDMISAKQRRIAELHDEYFTFGGTCRQVVRMLDAYRTPGAVNAIASRRRFA